MSTVCMYRQDNGIIKIGSDSLVSGRYTPRDVSGGPKYVLTDGGVLAVCGRLLALNLIEEHADKLLAPFNPSMQDVARDLRALFAGAGLVDGETGLMEEEVVVIRDHTINAVDTRFAHHRLADRKFWAIGSGAQYALGAADVLMGDKDIKPAKVVSESLAAAVRLDPDTGGRLFYDQVPMR